MKKKKFPSISVVIPTFNSEATLESCISSIRKQDYPQGKIDIILADGGSRDKTYEIAKKYRARVIKVNPKKQNVELNKSIGIKNAKGEILFMLDHDNILTTKNLMSRMITPFLENKDVVGVETLRYHYDPKETLLDRYFALFGVNDPLAYYMGKADRMPYFINGYEKKYNPIDMGKYYTVNFYPGKIPTIGANGFMVRRKILIKNADIRPGRYFPIDVNVDLIRKGFNKYAFTKDSIYHLSGRSGVVQYLKRRILFMKQYYLSKDTILQKKVRRYSLYEEKDFLRLMYFIVISVTFVVPLFDSIKGYLRIKDLAWFMNPVMCFGFVLMYGYAVIVHQFKIIVKKISK